MMVPNFLYQCHFITVSFSVFLVILGDIDLKNFFKKSKSSRMVFLERPSTYHVEKKSKIVRVTAKSIWVGMTHIHF